MNDWDKYRELNLMIKPTSECTCVDVAMGSYDNVLLLGYYAVMLEYRDRRKAKGLSENGISVDKCLVDEIVMLWKSDIITFGCCCGHGIKEGMINIKYNAIDKLIELGYDIFSIVDNGSTQTLLISAHDYKKETKGVRK